MAVESDDWYSIKRLETMTKLLESYVRRPVSQAWKKPPPKIGLTLLLAGTLLLGQVAPIRAALAPGPDAFGYSVATTTNFTFTNITSGTKVLNFHDDQPVTVNIGFSFNFYGSNYSTASFNPNGLITFGGSTWDYSNANLTVSSATTNNLPCIAVLWDDWETESLNADALYYKTIGMAGSRQFIVQWNMVVPVNGDGTNDVTFEARLFEGNNQILLSYLDTVVSDETTLPPNAASRGVGATVGIRATNGQSNNRNLLWSYNQAVITNGENILFTRTNHPPVAADDTVATQENISTVINTLANDSDVDGNLLTVTNVTQPAQGIATVNANSTVTYKPATNYIGGDSFTYTVSDGWGGTATATVNVTVTPDHPPMASPESYSVNEDTLLTVNAPGVLANDSDVDGDPLVAVLVAGPAQGILTLGSNGSFTYRPFTNFNGADSFTYAASDGTLASNAVVTITVNPVNDPPTAGLDYSDTHQNTPRSVLASALLSNDSDPDAGDQLSITGVSATSTAGGSVSLTSGRIRYVPPASFTGVDTFTYTVSDGHGGTATGTVQVTVWPPLQVTAIELVPGGNLQIRYQGIPFHGYPVQASADLVNWTPPGIFTADGTGAFQFEVTDVANQPQSFYRVVLDPGN